MKKTIALLPVLALTLLALPGCNKPETGAPSVGKPSAAVAEKNSFQQVTSQLEPGGSLYVYLSTEQLTAGISDRISKFHSVITGLPNVQADQKEKIDKVFDVVSGLVKDSGIEDVSGFGASSVMHEEGLYHNKCLLHHYQGKGSGFLWTMFGQKAHALDGLDLLPDNTAIAYFGDTDLALLWSTIQKEVGRAQLPQADELLAKLPAQFEQATGLKWEQVLGSLGGEYGFALMLDDAHKITLPIPNAPLEMPEPSLMLAIKVKDDTIFNRLDKLMKQSGQEIVAVDKPNLKMRTLPLPLPLPIQVRPTIASSQGYLLIANSDHVIEQALDVKAGKAKGLKANAEFKRLSTDVPLEGNHFTFVSQRLGNTILQVQQQALQMASSSSGQQGGAAEALKSMLGANAAGCGFSVSANTDEGWRGIGNGNQHPAKVLLALTIVPASIAAGVAIPAFIKARQAAQNKNASLENPQPLDAPQKQLAATEAQEPERRDLVKH